MSISAVQLDQYYVRKAVRPGQDLENPSGDRDAILAVFHDVAPSLPYVRPSQKENFKRESLDNSFKALTDDKKQFRYTFFVCCTQKGSVKKVEEIVGVIFIGNSPIAQATLERLGVESVHPGAKLASMAMLYTKPDHRGGEHSPAQLLLRKVEAFARKRGFDGIYFNYNAHCVFQREEGEEGGVVVHDPTRLVAYYERWGARSILRADGTFAGIADAPCGEYRTPVEKSEEGLILNHMVKIF